jgi:hypothetical protein
VELRAGETYTATREEDNGTGFAHTVTNFYFPDRPTPKTYLASPYRVISESELRPQDITAQPVERNGRLLHKIDDGGDSPYPEECWNRPGNEGMADCVRRVTGRVPTPENAPSEESTNATYSPSAPTPSSSGTSSLVGKTAWISCRGFGSRSSLALENDDLKSIAGEVKCGARVTIQRENSESHVSQVLTAQGVSGWISPEHLVMSDPPDPSY